MECAGNIEQTKFFPEGFLKPHLKCDKCGVMGKATYVNVLCSIKCSKIRSQSIYFLLFNG